MSDRIEGLIDISRALDPAELPLWPGAPELVLERWLDLHEGDSATDTRVSMSLHTGTHLDAPAHRLPEGDTVEDLGLDSLNGRCSVFDLSGRDRITCSSLEAAGVPPGCERLLLKTDNSADRSGSFDPSFVALTPDAAAFLAGCGLRLVGVDYLSVEAPDGDGRVHRHLLWEGVALLEGLDLGAVPPGEYRLWCLPLKFVGTEAAPARACLLPVRE